MPERAIRIFGDPVLKAKAETIAVPDVQVKALVADLLDSVRLAGRAGVAAPQIGVGLRAFSYNVAGSIGCILNPELVEVSGKIELIQEGCLSLPGMWHPTPRHPYARVRGIDVNGQPIEVEGTGTLAQALQHECDHLDGVLYIDRLEPSERRNAMRAIRESDWFRSQG